MADRMHALLQASYPEVNAGGFTRDDGTIQFYLRVQALLQPGQRVLDFGAGRGSSLHDPKLPPFKRKLRDLAGDGRFLVGADVDPAVRENPSLQEAHVLDPKAPLPFPEHSFDLICSDFVFEHIAEPDRTCRELDRILKPGGWICARTPNRFGYIALASSAVANRHHGSILRWLQPFRETRDVFPTVYKLNTPGALRRHFPESRYVHCVFRHEAEPTYFGSNRLLWKAGMAARAVLPDALKNGLMVFLQKRRVGLDASPH